MTSNAATSSERAPAAAVPCAQCPLRSLPLFQAHEDAELELVQSLKRKDMHLPVGSTLIQEGQVDAPLYTLL